MKRSRRSPIVTRSSTKRLPKRSPRSIEKKGQRDSNSSHSNDGRRQSTKKETIHEKDVILDEQMIVDNEEEEEKEEEEEEVNPVNRDLLTTFSEEVDDDEDEQEDEALEEVYELNRTREVDLGEEGEDAKGEDHVEVEEEEEEDDDDDEEDVIDSDEEFDLEEESSSEDEGPRNTIGNVPLSWYDEYDHIGYDREGKRIVRKNQPQSAIMEALRQADDPDYLRTVYDAYNDESIRLSTEEIQTAIKVLRGQYAGSDAEVYYPMIPIESKHFPGIAPEPKRRFVPSKWEHKKVMRIVRAIRKGWIKVDEKPQNEDDSHMNYVLWDDEKDEEQDPFRRIQRLPPPKLPLPTHAHSYNPPEEYLFFDDEKKRDGLDIRPKRFPNLRSVPAFPRFMKERFNRCLDLYLCPRSIKRDRPEIDPESLLPELPKPEELRPFPTTESLLFTGHTSRVRSISMHPSGEWIVSCGDDQTVRLWEVDTGRELEMWSFTEDKRKNGEEEEEEIDEFHRVPVSSVQWCPAVDKYCFIAVTVGDRIEFIMPKHEISGALIHENTKTLLREMRDWIPTLRHKKNIRLLEFHKKGDYFASVCDDRIMIHQISKKASQIPFKKAAFGRFVQKLRFHPAGKPQIFVATQRFVRIFDLVQQSLVAKLETGVKWISSMYIHPSGDHLIVGSYDKVLEWFDLDLRDKPYRVLRVHRMAIRDVCMHPVYPLFASVSDDRSIQVFHGTVFDDLTKDPLIVPVKRIREAHKESGGLGILCSAWHPKQPWLFTGGADGTVRMFV